MPEDLGDEMDFKISRFQLEECFPIGYEKIDLLEKNIVAKRNEINDREIHG